MEILHLLGHRHNWNLDSYYQNNIGDGFIFCAYSFPFGYFDRDKINTYKTPEVLSKSFIDLQYFASKEAANKEKGNLDSYPFHPASNADGDKQTNVVMLSCIKKGIKYQTDTLGLKNVIIPNYYENNDLNRYIGLTKEINKWLKTNKKDGVKYYMTLPLANHTIIDKDKIEHLLYHLTDMDISFDGYYVICESKPETGHKVSVDFKYLTNLSTVFQVLKMQGFTTIYSYANWDVILFASLAEIDYITVGTYENLRNFSIRRFTEDEGMRLSKGWYFSEKILNFIKSPLIDNVRLHKGLDLIRNEKNIFSDAVLVDGYLWNHHKAEVHKNYLTSISRILKQIDAEKDPRQKKRFILDKIQHAISNYTQLEKKGIYLTEESRNYHLGVWESFMKSKMQ